MNYFALRSGCVLRDAPRLDVGQDIIRAPMPNALRIARAELAAFCCRDSIGFACEFECVIQNMSLLRRGQALQRGVGKAGIEYSKAPYVAE